MMKTVFNLEIKRGWRRYRLVPDEACTDCAFFDVRKNKDDVCPRLRIFASTFVVCQMSDFNGHWEEVKE